MTAFVIPLYYVQTVIWPPADRPFTADVVDEALDNLEIDAAIVAPSVLEDMSQSQASLEKLARLKNVKFGGGKSFSTIARSMRTLIVTQGL